MLEKMSKSSQTEPSIGEISPETVKAAAASQQKYQEVRKRLHCLYGDGSTPRERSSALGPRQPAPLRDRT